MFKLTVEAETIEELAFLVSAHHNELSSITKAKAAPSGFGEALANHIMPPVVTTSADVAEITTDGQLDADGLPWDERIHSSSKKLTAKGVWARRKNIDDSVFNQVVNQLRGGTVNVQPAVTVPNIPPVQYNPLNIPQVLENPPAPLPAFLQNMNVAPAAPAPVPPAPIAPIAPTPAAQTIGDLFNKIQQLFADNKADAAYVISLQNRIGQQFQVQISSITDISGRTDMIAYAFQLIAADGR